MSVKHPVLQYVINNAVAFDRSFNAATGGDPDETLSSRMGKAIAAGRCSLCKPICWALGLIQTNHCAKSAANNPNAGAEEVIEL